MDPDCGALSLLSLSPAVLVTDWNTIEGESIGFCFRVKPNQRDKNVLLKTGRLSHCPPQDQISVLHHYSLRLVIHAYSAGLHNNNNEATLTQKPASACKCCSADSLSPDYKSMNKYLCRHTQRNLY